MSYSRELITIGKILKPFGVKGEVRVHSLSDVPGRFELLEEVALVSSHAPALTTQVTSIRQNGDSYILALSALSTPEQAACFRGALLKIHQEEVPPLPEGQFYQFELLGLTVYDLQGRDLGCVEEVIEMPAHHVFVVRQGARERLIPAVQDLIKEIDLPQRRMIVTTFGQFWDDDDAL